MTKTGCAACDTEGPFVWADQYGARERHVVFHHFGRTVMHEMVEPWANPLLTWMSKVGLPRASRAD